MSMYRGYPIAVIAFLSTGLTIGTSQYSFGEFVGPLRDQFGWTQTQINLSLSFAFVSGLVAPLVGKASDRWGSRPVTVVSLALIAAGFLLRPLVTELWHWYLFSALVYAGFPGATSLPAGRLVGLWFPATRGRVMGAVTSGNNFGGLTMPPLAAAVILVAGWRWGYAVFGVVMAALAVVALLVIREDAELVDREMAASGRTAPAGGARATAGAGVTLQEALRTQVFWLMLTGLVMASFTYQGALTQLRQHFAENGFTPFAATAGVAVIAAMGVGSKLSFGYASERITARVAIMGSIALQAVGLTIMATASSVPVMWAGIIAFGMGFGGLGALIVLVVQEAFGLRQFGTLLGVVSVAQIGSFAGAPVIAGWLHDSTGSYDAAFLLIVGCFLLAIVAFAVAGPRAAGGKANRA